MPAGDVAIAADGAVADRTRLDEELSPSRSAKDALGEIGRWIDGTTAARQQPGLRVRAGLAYGPAPRQRLDVYDDPRIPAPARGKPVAVFIHGGFWQEGSIDHAGFAAPAFAAAGWLFVAVGYTLAPEATLGTIIDEVRLAWKTVVDQVSDWGGDPSRIVVAGHSAGGHLAASLVCPIVGVTTPASPDQPTPPALPAALLLISGVFDLAPIARSIVNDVVGMSPSEAIAWSPIRSRPQPLPVHVVVGADEPREFRRQSRLLVDRWRDAMPVTVTPRPGRDHFDVVAAVLQPHGAPFARVGEGS